MRIPDDPKRASTSVCTTLLIANAYARRLGSRAGPTRPRDSRVSKGEDARQLGGLRVSTRFYAATAWASDFGRGKGDHRRPDHGLLVLDASRLDAEANHPRPKLPHSAFLESGGQS